MAGIGKLEKYRKRIERLTKSLEGDLRAQDVASAAQTSRKIQALTAKYLALVGGGTGSVAEQKKQLEEQLARMKGLQKRIKRSERDFRKYKRKIRVLENKLCFILMDSPWRETPQILGWHKNLLAAFVYYVGVGLVFFKQNLHYRIVRRAPVPYPTRAFIKRGTIATAFFLGMTQKELEAKLAEHIRGAGRNCTANA